MTDNIQKLYEIAGVEKKPVYSGSQLYNPVITGYEYPLFTAEKQLELIKWMGIGKIVEFDFRTDINKWLSSCCTKEDGWTFSEHNHFDQALAGLILQLWDELSSEQREEVGVILQ